MKKKTLDCIWVCNSLLKYYEILFVAGDEKWLLYSNVELKKLWYQSYFPPKKVLYDELFPEKLTNDLNKYHCD